MVTEASATQMFLQCWQQVKITCGQALDYTLDTQKSPLPKFLNNHLRFGSSMQVRTLSLLF
jgi:hypothetical protein